MNWAERNERARQWLISHDPEEADFWAGLPASSDFIEAMDINLRDFGPDTCCETEHVELGDSFA